MFHSSRSESCGTEGGGSIIYPATGACYLHHGDHAGEIALETERRLSSSSCSGAASGWSRRPRGTMSKWTNGASVSFTPIDPGSATISKEAFQVPRFKPLWGKQRLMHGCFGLGKAALYFPVRKWPDKCQSLPYDETTPVEKGIGKHNEPTANQVRSLRGGYFNYSICLYWSGSDFTALAPFKSSMRMLIQK